MDFLKSSDIRNELKGIRTIILPDTGGGIVDDTFLRRSLVPSWMAHLASYGLEYRKEAFDCDKFARLFASWAILSAARSGHDWAALVGWAAILTDTGAHAVNICRTQVGWQEIEPQNGRVIPWNRDPDDVLYIVL